MKNILSIIVFLFALEIHAADFYMPTSTKDCIENPKSQPAIPNPNLTEEKIDEACYTNESAPLDQGICRKTLTATQKSYDTYVKKLKTACQMVDEYNRYDTCIKQQTCLTKFTQLNKKTAGLIDGMLNQLKDLIGKLEEAKKASKNKINEIGQSVAMIEPEATRLQTAAGMIQNAQANANDAAAKLGGVADSGMSTVESAYYNQNNGMKAADILKLAAATQSGISESSLESTQSPLVGEQLYAAYVAEVTQKNFEIELQRLGAQKSQLLGNAESSTDSQQKLGAIDPNAKVSGASPESAAAAPKAAGGFNPNGLAALSGLGAIADNQPATTPGNYYIPARLASTEAFSDAISSSDKAAALAAENKKAQIEAKVPGSTEKNLPLAKGSSGKSKMPGGKAAAGLANQAANSEGSIASPTGEKNIETDKQKNSKAPKEKTKENLLSSFENTDLSRGLELAGSETDSFIDGVVKDLEDKEKSSSTRDPASERISGAHDIGAENGPSLFIRMRHVYEKCIKKSCVSKVISEKI